MTSPVFTEALVRRFGDLVAVDRVDLEIADGEIFGFLGPNGAGKSTLVRMLTTLLRPTEGVAKVAGFDVVREADKVRRSIGVALQDAAIDPLMTGTELLRLQATLHGIPKGQIGDRSVELLDRVGLTAAADRKVGEYSGGMRRRLDLAMALVHRPNVLFLDEPTTGLDPSSRRNLWDEVRTLNSEGTTVFLTTQYLEEADQLADRIAIIDHGRIVREGKPAELKARVGAPTLVLQIDPAHLDLARETLCQKFGAERPSKQGWLAIGLEGGASMMTAVIRTLDGVGADVQHIELNAPSLDDVFAEATGRRLEGAVDGAAEHGIPAEGMPAGGTPAGEAVP